MLGDGKRPVRFQARHHRFGCVTNDKGGIAVERAYLQVFVRRVEQRRIDAAPAIEYRELSSRFDSEHRLVLEFCVNQAPERIALVEPAGLVAAGYVQVQHRICVRIPLQPDSAGQVVLVTFQRVRVGSRKLQHRPVDHRQERVRGRAANLALETRLRDLLLVLCIAQACHDAKIVAKIERQFAERRNRGGVLLKKRKQIGIDVPGLQVGAQGLIDLGAYAGIDRRQSGEPPRRDSVTDQVSRLEVDTGDEVDRIAARRR